MITLDLTGLKCPLPVLKTRNALRTLLPGQTVRVICTDPLSLIDIPHLIRETGDHLQAQSQDDGTISFMIIKAPSP